MKFQEMLLAAIERAEIPLRFEPGAGEAVAKPVTEMLRGWILAHMPPDGGACDQARLRMAGTNGCAQVGAALARPLGSPLKCDQSSFCTRSFATCTACAIPSRT